MPRYSYEAKAGIEEALRRSGELGASLINVEVEGSTVKLYGSVRSSAEREGRASRVVCIWDYNGQKPHYDQSVIKRSDHSYRNIFIRRHIGLLLKMLFSDAATRPHGRKKTCQTPERRACPAGTITLGQTFLTDSYPSCSRSEVWIQQTMNIQYDR